MEICNSGSSSLLDCPVCLQGYTTKERIPKIFTCGHSICSSCAERKISSCPICRQSVSSKGMKNLPTNFPLLQIIECLEQKPKPCPEHPHYTQDHICMDDKALICLYCSTYGNHRGHNVQPLRQFENQVNSAVQQSEEEFSKLDSFLKSQVEQMKLDVVHQFSEILNLITGMRDDLLLQIDKGFREEYMLRDEKLQVMEYLKNSAQTLQNNPAELEYSRTFAASVPIDYTALEIKVATLSSNIFFPIDELKRSINEKFQINDKIVEESGVDINVLCGNDFLGIKVQVTETIDRIKNRLTALYPQLRDQEYDLTYNRKILRGNARISDYNIQSYIPLEIKNLSFV